MTHKVNPLTPAPLPRAFYERDVEAVARELLGKRLIRRSREGLTSGTIVEVEAYRGCGDPASHAYRGRTRRNAAMFGRAGHAYVYAIHAKYCMNAVAGSRGVASAVLIRALEPRSGIPLMASRRARSNVRELTRGPAMLCQSFHVGPSENRIDLTHGRRLWVGCDPAFDLAGARIGVSPRIGVTSAKELRLRYYLAANKFVSGTRKFNERFAS